MNPHHCWEWQGYVGKNGYASFRMAGTTRSVHRISFELAKGPIPEGLVIDHLCRVRHCVNPDHLEAVTQQENVQRYTRLVTSCPKGHAYDDINTRRNPQGRRLCIECGRKDSRERARRKREESRCGI